MNILKAIIAIFNPQGPHLDTLALERELNSAAITAQIRSHSGRLYAL
jgi:hypothetical protein